MILYIDENLPKRFAEGLHTLQEPENYRLKLKDPIEVKSLLTAFGEGVTDEIWIPAAGKQKACVLTQDFNIYNNKHQRELYKQFSLVMFFIRHPRKRNLLYWDILQLIVKHWPEMIKIMVGTSKPFAYSISKNNGITNLHQEKEN
ncbi:MAG: hypothetical protein ACNS62_00260 [Candidatus Cyclobacteriaceae bacterium M3_2C_046]